MRIFRIADARHPIWDGTGAALLGGRWNSPGRTLIYGSLTYAGAMLEILAHANIGRIPQTHRLVIAKVPDDIPIERHDPTTLPPDWDAENSACAKNFGDRWLIEARSAVLLLPSVVARREWNALVTPAHPDAVRLTLAPTEPVVWDKRLFARQPDASPPDFET